MAGRLEGKVAVISGAARGIGAAAARRFVAEGAKVLIGDILDDDGKQTADDIGDGCVYQHLDVTSEDDWAAAIERAETEFGPVSVLVNNAGILEFGSIPKTSKEQFLKTVMVNQVGCFLGMQAVIGSMEKAGGGAIVNTSSVEGLGGMPWLIAYTASKWAVRGMSKAAALELTRQNIRVNSIHPGAIKTPMTGAATESAGGSAEEVDIIGQMVPLKRMGQPEEVANLMLFLASDESAYCTGAEFVMDGGATASSGFKV